MSYLFVPNRKRLSIGSILGVPASIDNKYVPGSGVGARSPAVRRVLVTQSTTPDSTRGYRLVPPMPPANVVATLVNGGLNVTYQIVPPNSPETNSDVPILYYIVTSNPGNIVVQSYNTNVTVTGLTFGVDYTFTVVAVNKWGRSTASSSSAPFTYCTVPGAPTSLSATGGDQYADISFTPPSNNGGGVITNYQYSIDGTTFTAFSPADAASPVRITGLVNDQLYTVYLKAVNVAGAGPASASVSVTPVSIPPAPTNLVATPGDRSASIAFTEVFGGTITNYKYSTNGTSFTAFSPAQTTSPVSLTSLTNGQSYTFYLKAVSATGDSPASASVTVIPMTTSNAPTSLSAASGNNQATITFTKPSNNGGSAITNYQYSTDGTNYTAFGTPTGDVSSVTITGLSNGTPYTIYLKAVNAAGAGTASSSVSVTPRTTANAPTSLSATAGNASITISFTKPSNNGGSAITNYKYNTGSGFTAFGTPTGDVTSVTITGLSNDTNYNIYLRAVTAAGDGAVSSPVSITPTATIPGSWQFSGANKNNYLTLTPGVALGGDDFVVECWFNNTTADWALNGGLFGGSSNFGMSIFITNNINIQTDAYGGNGANIFTVPTMVANTWYHFALVRKSGSVNVFLNGTRSSTVNISNNINYSGLTSNIGNFYNGNSWAGYITNVRMVVGSAGVSDVGYDPANTSITVPTLPLTNKSGTRFLNQGNNFNDLRSIQTVTNGTTPVVLSSPRIVPF